MKTRHALVMPLLLLGACGEDAGRPGDVSTDTTSDTGTDTTSDTSADTDTSTGTDADTDTDIDMPGRTVAGTNLEGITVTWTETLELCTAWNEGASLADEKRRKIRVLIPPQARPSFDETPMAGARLEGVDLRRGPDAVDRHRPLATGERTELTTWQLFESGADDILTVSIAHALAGGAGTLHETWTVGRAPGDARPVVVTADNPDDVRFAYEPPEGDLEPAPLERCGGPTAYEDAVSVLVAKDEGGKKWATLVRYWRTPNSGGVTAGSQPVTLVGHRLFTSESPWWADEASGLWANTYVAAHHNFDDASEVDYTRDLGRWHTLFREPDPLATPVTKVSLAGVLGFDAASMTIERWSAGGDTRETLDVPAPRRFPRVDAAALGRRLAQWCDDGVVLAAGGGDHAFQMLFCDDAETRALTAIVPVIWAREPTLAGELIGADVITPTAEGWEVGIGTTTLAIKPQEDGAFYTELSDGGGEIISSAWEVGYALGPWPAAREETVTGQSDDGAVSFELLRRWAGFGVGKSQLWAPVHFALTFGGNTYHVEAWDRLAYENTHHNWNDVLEATTDEGHLLRWSTDFMNGVPNLVSATGADGEVLLAPTTIRSR